jgi:hypothetical protein
MVPLALDLLRLCIWLALLLAVFAPIERRWALHRQKLLRKAFGTDLVYFFVGGLVPKLLLILPMTLIAGGVHHVWTGGFYAWVTGMPLGCAFRRQWWREKPARIGGIAGRMRFRGYGVSTLFITARRRSTGW